MNIKIKGWHILVIALILLFLWWNGYIQFAIKQPQQQPAEELVAVNKPIKFSLTDPLKGSAVASANIYIYTPDKILRESLITGSDGTITSALPYKSDSVLYVKVVKSGYVTSWFTVTVPKMSPADAQSLTFNFVPLQVVTLGTYTIKVTDQFGNSYSSGGLLNFTSLGVTSISITITIYNTADNTGYVTSKDQINNVLLAAVLEASTPGSAVTVSGAGQSVVRGTTSYWLTQLSDDGLTRKLVGNVYTKPGVSSVTITFGKGSLAKGQTQAFTFKLMIYYDPAYFAVNGIGGPDATSVATFTLNLGA
jgi:cytoskeletal protein RodZ